MILLNNKYYTDYDVEKQEYIPATEEEIQAFLNRESSIKVQANYWEADHS